MIELYNNGADSVNVGGWFVSDNRSNPYSYKFPADTYIKSGDYLVVDESDFNPGGMGFRFNRSGENCYLFAANSDSTFTGYATGVSFDGQYNGTSFGIYTNSENQDHFVAQSSRTFGAKNAYPVIGPLVISRVMYNPNIY